MAELLSFSEEPDEGLGNEDFKAIRSLAGHRGAQALLRYAEDNMAAIEQQVFGDEPCTEPGYFALTRQWIAYRDMRDMLSNPPVDEETENE